MQTPMFHAASMLGILAPRSFGGRVVFIPMFNPDGVLDLIESHDVTDTLMVPTMIGMCLASPDYRPERLASLRQLVYGASPMPEAMLDRLQSGSARARADPGLRHDRVVLDGHAAPARGPRARLAAAALGRPSPRSACRSRSRTRRANRCPRGEIGEVCVRGGQLMREYWNKPDATAEVFRGGWYHTGDAGYLDDDGYLFLVDRVKDMIVTGGENVYSAEVESAISTHPGVAQVAVIGIPARDAGARRCTRSW